jgi:hypothetical protein
MPIPTIMVGELLTWSRLLLQVDLSNFLRLQLEVRGFVLDLRFILLPSLATSTLFSDEHCLKHAKATPNILAV